MNLIKLPIPDHYEYIDVDKIISLDFNACNGQLTVELSGAEVPRVYYENAKQVLDRLLEATHCEDGIPKIKKKKALVETKEKSEELIYAL